MSGVVDTIVDVVNAVIAITLTVTLIGPTLSLVSPEFAAWYADALEPVMAILGIKDEDVISAEVVDQRLMDDTNVDSLITKLALQHQKTQKGVIELLAQFSAGAKGSMTRYFQYGKDTYYNGLPNTSIKGTVIPPEVIDVISGEYLISPVVISSKAVKVPTKEEYAYYRLNKLYGYESWTNLLVYLTNSYAVKFIDYNFGTNNYDITIYRPGTETTEVTITITNIDATTDNRHTYTKVTTVLAESTTIVETNTDTVIPIGTEVDSYTTSTIAIECGTTVISIVAYALNLNYVIQWYSLDSSHIMYWCYEIGSGGSIILDNAQRYSTNLEMMPVVEIRNNKININNNKESTEYTHCKSILDYVGLDIDGLTASIDENPSIADITNAYVYFGIDMQDTSPTVAKMLYHSFEFIYDQNMLDENTDTYSAYFTEGNYNSTMLWRDQVRTVVNGSIGSVGTYTSTIVGASITLRKQHTSSQYIEFQIIDVGSTTFIKEGALYAVVAKQLKDGGVIMPISRYIADQLTPVEQLEIFGKSLRLSIYSATITHLEWYQTPEFFSLIKILIIIASIVILIYSGGNAYAAGQFLEFALTTLAIMAVAFAFNKLLASTDNPWLKALYVAVAVVIVAETGMMDTTQLGFFTADQLTTIVTQFSEFKMEQLVSEARLFSEIAADRLEELEDKLKAFEDLVSTEFIAGLQTLDNTVGYIEGIDLMMYKAVGLNNESIHRTKEVYGTIFDYDKYYRLGVV